jgi:hypothetical protein
MPQDAEIALAKSAAPDNISAKATIKVLTASGFQIVHEGENRFVCLVMRGSAAPTFTPAQVRDLVYDAKLRAPICFNPQASETVMPYYELRNRLAMEGKTPDEITKAIQAAYSKASAQARGSQLRVHVVSGSESWTVRPLAPTHDGLLPRELDARR